MLRDGYLFRQGWVRDESWRGLHKEYARPEFIASRGTDHVLNIVACIGWWAFVLPYSGLENRAEALFKNAPLGEEELIDVLRRIATEGVEHAW